MEANEGPESITEAVVPLLLSDKPEDPSVSVTAVNLSNTRIHQSDPNISKTPTLTQPDSSSPWHSQREREERASKVVIPQRVGREAHIPSANGFYIVAKS